ncbi:MAG: hypothetical protein DRJ35_03870 [Thermoprotei archaeon]|nr:MAG: hypothetical protein DRJ35_03870 [Thermoprotei archaeon]
MARACKIFEVMEPLAPEEIYESLEGYSQLWEEEVDGRTVSVGFRVANIDHSGETVWGVVEESFISRMEFRGEEIRVPVSLTIEFSFIEYDKRQFLIVYAGKRRADRLAVRFSEILYDRRDVIVEVYIPPEKMRTLYLDKVGEVRIVILDNLRIPGLSKVTLFGKDLKDSDAFMDYLKKGRESYVVYRDEEGVFGVSRMGQIIAFSRIDSETLESYLREKIIPLAEPPPE